jgi:glutamyl-tRNA synthetase
MLLGWAPKDNRELFTLPEFVQHFDIDGFQEANPRFLTDKLDWLNGEYIRQKTDEQFINLTSNYFQNYDISIYRRIVPLIKDRIKKLSDVKTYAGFFFTSPVVDRDLLGKNYKEHLAKAIEAIEKGTPLDQAPKDNDFKVGDFFMDLRIAITGSKFTPPINESIEILGKEESLKRLRKVLE